MKKIVLILAALTSLMAFGQESATAFKTRLRQTNDANGPAPAWYFSKEYHVIDWVSTMGAYYLDQTDTVASKVLTRTIAVPLFLENGDTVASKVLTRTIAVPLFLENGDTVASKVLTRKIADPLYMKATNEEAITKTARKGLDTLFSISLATLKMAGGSIRFSANSTDGTDMQSKTGHIIFSVVNKGGAYTSSIVATADSTIAASTGTYTQNWSIATGTNVAYICVHNLTSLTPTSLKIYYTVRKGSDQTFTKWGN